MRRRLRPAGPGAMVALAALVVALGTEASARGPSPVVFPAQKLPLKFSHKQHLAFKLDCDFCHESAPGSLTAADNLTPVEDSCTSCHKIDRELPEKVSKPAARCDSCHYYVAHPAGALRTGSPDEPRSGGPSVDFNQPRRVEMPAPNLKFNHKVHADRGIKCERCHGTMRAKELGTRDDLPLMPLCLGCHNNLPISRAPEQGSSRAPAPCATCHITQPDSTLQTEFPTGRLAPSGTLKGDTHTLDFATHHATVGRDEARYCENCHRKDFCLSCHNGVVKPLSFHGNDYLQIHPIDARKATLNCDGCHRRQTFCLGCHERTGLVVPDPNTSGPDNYLHNLSPERRFHPPPDRWVSGPRTPDHHSWQAERNLRSCVSCHREESCMQCHATAGVKTLGLPSSQPYHTNPHPPGFAGSRQCDALSARNGRVCLKCHAPDDTDHLSCR